MIGGRLAEARKNADLTQKELAQMIGYGKDSISAYERDKAQPNDETTVKLAQILKVSTDYLLGKSRNPKPYIISSNAIRLPEKISINGRKELENFLDYLMYKYDCF